MSSLFTWLFLLNHEGFENKQQTLFAFLLFSAMLFMPWRCSGWKDVQTDRWNVVWSPVLGNLKSRTAGLAEHPL